MLQVGLEEQVAAFLGRGHYERGTTPRGWRNGYGTQRLKTEAGPLALRPPKVRNTPNPFQGQRPAGLAQTTPELRALVTRASVRGLSARDIEGLYTEVFGGRFSRSAASRAAKSLQADFDAWRQRDLSNLQVVSLFLDGQFHAARSGTAEQEGILAAYALLEDGRAVLLHLGLGPRESTEPRWPPCTTSRPAAWGSRSRYPSAMECLERDLEEGVTYLLFPGEHRRRIRTTNLLERAFGESRRRTKVIPRFPGERACLRLLFATLITASARWRGVRMTPKILRALDALRTDGVRQMEQTAA